MKEREMKFHLPEVDMDKLAKTLEIKDAYNTGKISLQEARRQIRESVVSLKPYEIALAEQELKSIEEDECRKEDIQAMMDLFSEVLDISRPDLPLEHPISCYYQENDEMRKHLLAIEDLVQYPIIKNQWLELYDELQKYRIHLSRKQNQLYSILEKKGFDRPTTTMWLLDDFIRDEISQARSLLEQDLEEQFIALQPTLVADIRDLMQKEEAVLYPTSLAMITAQEFVEMVEGDREIGYAWINPSVEPRAMPSHPSEAGHIASEGFASELSALLGKYGYNINSSDQQKLQVTTGELTLEQINLIYKHLPIDISFVDENELVCFYSDTDHRVFPRSRNVIGRDVKNCHPRTSVHLVEEIIEKFRSGEQDSVDFWINKPGVFIYIYYVAVRDAQGRFRGVLEMMQDCSRIRALEGSRTLLHWGQGTTAMTKDSPHQPAPADPTPPKDESPELNEHSPQTGALEITPETKLKALLERHPFLKTELPRINPSFKMLSTPLARIMIPKADVTTMSERSGVPLERLISELKRIILEKEG